MSVFANSFWRPGRLLELGGWILVAALVALLVVQFTGWTAHRLIAATHSSTPYLLAAALPFAAIALISQRWLLAGAFGAVAVGFVVLAWPILAPPPQPEVAAGAAELRVFHANVYYGNDQINAMVSTLEQLDVDVLVLTEYTEQQSAAMLASTLAERFPERVEYPRDRGGSAIWSRYPLIDLPTPQIEAPSTMALVDAPDPVVVYAVHTTSPLTELNRWRSELALLTTDPFGSGDRTPAGPVPTGTPVLMVGDFNASFWHPEFRQLLDWGWTDAHQAMRRGFSTSWPSDRRGVPTLVRLDHALLSEGLVATSVRDVYVPGSDHLGFIVSVARSAP